MKRPTFFISSTIHDFRDLRSALKFFLEELGCKVLASEYNDFEKPLDVHSYEACLRAIHAADYFILLIGSRVGGWYNDADRVSITQREYREAYQLQAAGKLKLLNFVRSEVWNVREDRRELAKFLESTGLDTTIRSTIANHPTKFATDAEFLISFINEVSRNAETQAAVHGLREPPTGNWIHTFTAFRDVIDVLNQHVLSSIPVEDMTVKRLLRRELRQLLTQCLVKFAEGKVVSPRWWIDRFHEDSPITLEGKHNEFTSVATKRWDAIATFSIHLLATELHVTVLPQVLARPTFLEFDLATNAYQETPVYEALLSLQHQIRRFNECNTTENLAVVYAHRKLHRSPNMDQIEIETTKLAALLNLFDRWSNVIDLSAAILKYLDGQPFQLPNLRPDTPVQGMQEMLEREIPTEADLNTFLAS
jgi:hypothetical protein